MRGSGATGSSGRGCGKQGVFGSNFFLMDMYNEISFAFLFWEGTVKFCILSFLSLSFYNSVGGGLDFLLGFGGEFVGSISGNVAHSLHVFQFFLYVSLPQPMSKKRESGTR